MVAGLLTAHGLVGTEGRLIEKETARCLSNAVPVCRYGLRPSGPPIRPRWNTREASERENRERESCIVGVRIVGVAGCGRTTPSCLIVACFLCFLLHTTRAHVRVSCVPLGLGCCGRMRAEAKVVYWPPRRHVCAVAT